MAKSCIATAEAPQKARGGPGSWTSRERARACGGAGGRAGARVHARARARDRGTPSWCTSVHRCTLEHLGCMCPDACCRARPYALRRAYALLCLCLCAL